MESLQSMHTQFDGASSSPPIDIVIGFDFGTSSTRVVMRSPFIQGGRAQAVDWGRLGHKDNPHFLPTRPYFDQNGQLNLVSIPSGAHFPALKMKVIDEVKGNRSSRSSEMTHTHSELAVGYIGQALRIARMWFISTQQKIYGTRSIRWHLNLGIPSTGHSDDDVRKHFLKLAHAAWEISVHHECPTLNICLEALEKADTSIALPEIDNSRIHVIPEISAQVIGYSKSTSRKNGLHLLIDVGAGTTDICCFNLFGDEHGMLASSVERLGVYELHTVRINEMRNRIEQWLKSYGSQEDPLHPLPVEVVDYFPTKKDNGLALPFAGDEQFKNEIMRTINKVLHYVRKRRYPNAPEWKSGITTFLTGGGSHVQVYRNARDEVNDWWQRNARVFGLKRHELEVPSNLVMDKTSKADYHRFSVAYGLSHTIDELGTIIPECDIRDVSPEAEPVKYDTAEFVSKDQV